MCEAEEELARAERDIAWLECQVELVVEYAADVDRGLISTDEFRRMAADVGQAARKVMT